MPKTFEELEVWQKAMALVKAIYSLTNNEKFNRDFSLTDQIRRASISVLSNIAEGFERGTNAEFIQFLYIAKGSCGEVRSQLYVAYELRYISKEDFHKCLEICKDISGQLSGFITYLKGSRMKGEKFKTEYKSIRNEVEDIVKEFNIQSSKFKKE
jgi:four helix bundle protein